MATATPAFDVLPTTAAQLQTLLTKGKITSVQIVETYLQQIEKHNHAGAKLNAVIATPERAIVLAKAAVLDGERKAGNLRGPLHGVPIIVKDCFTYEPGMGLGTTVGSHVFAQEKGIRNAAVIQQVSASENEHEAPTDVDGSLWMQE
jgi:amidase